MSAASPDLPERRFSQYLLVGGALFGALLLGLVAQSLIAFYFGAGSKTDALFMARDISEIAVKLLVPTQAAGVLVPLFLGMQRERSSEAWASVSAVLWAVLAVATPLVLAAVVFAPILVAVFAPGFDERTADETTTLLRYLAPTMWLSLGTMLAVSILQVRERFGLAMLANLIGQMVLVVALPPLVVWLGVKGASLAMLVGIAVQCSIALWFLTREGMPAFANPFRYRETTRVFARRTLPFLAYAGASQGSAVVYRISASTLRTGLFAALSFGSRIYRAVYSLIFLPIQTVLFPGLARHHAEGRPEDFLGELRATLRYVVYLVTPVVIAMVALRTETISLLFERGDFTAGATEKTAAALGVFALVLLPAGTYMLLEQAAFARLRTRVVITTNLGLESTQAALYFPLTAAFGIVGIPLAILVGMAVANLLYLVRLFPGSVRRSVEAQAGYLARVLVCALAMTTALLAVAPATDALFDPSPGLSQAAIVLPAATAGFASYLGMSHLLGLREPQALSRLLLGRLGALARTGGLTRGRGMQPPW